jgi:hypothetical protein
MGRRADVAQDHLLCEGGENEANGEEGSPVH